jgi:hypothetical protein
LKGFLLVGLTLLLALSLLGTLWFQQTSSAVAACFERARCETVLCDQPPPYAALVAFLVGIVASSAILGSALLPKSRR